MKTRDLENGAVEILDFDITKVTPEIAQEVKQILLQKLVVVIKKQDTNPQHFAKLVSSIGGLSNWPQCHHDITGEYIGAPTSEPDPYTWDESKPFPVQRVTGEKNKEGQFTGIFPLGKLDWHCNLNGPDRADGVALQAIHGAEGTVTSWNNTSLALASMPDELREKIRGKYASFYYNPENWADIASEEQRRFMLSNRHHYKMWVEQENAGGTKGLYLYTTNDCKIEGDDEFELYHELKDYLFDSRFIYNHHWETGDIVLSDQLLTMHKRWQEPDEIFEKRLLNRITFRLSNTGYPPIFVEKNKIEA